MNDVYDYVIVGAGSAGCVLAYRLASDPGTRVLLLEAGGTHRHPFISMPKGIFKIMASAAHMWAYMTEPDAATRHAAESWARGRVLGGSSAVNGMVYVRGQDADFDALARESSDDWSWRQIGAAYRALEGHELGAAATRGAEGPLKISLPVEPTPLIDAAIATGVKLGLSHKRDVNDPEDVERIGYAPRTIWKGRRQSAAVAFLDPIRQKPNLTIWTLTRADQILFDGDRAAGLLVSRNGAVSEVRARKEVLLTGGTLATPALLQRSGIGPADLLKYLGVPLRVESPGVGENVREHRGLVMQWRVRDDVSTNRTLRGWRLYASAARYYAFHRGTLAEGVYDAVAYFRSNARVARPDAQMLIAPFSMDYDHPGAGVEQRGGMNMCVYPLRPQSKGSVRIRSADPKELPVIRSGYGTATSDREIMVDLVGYARRFAATGPLADYVHGETRPGTQYQTDEQILDAHLKFGYGNYHACGSCRMGRDADSVVDPNLRVRGLRGLRVVDTSVFPEMPSGNTNGPATALAWRAADLIMAGQ